MNDSLDALTDYAQDLQTEIQHCVQSSFSFELFNDQWFNDWALRLFRLQSQSNPIYRRLLSYLNVSVDSLQDWDSIPAVPTTAFKEFDVTSLPAERRTDVFRSSGTTQADRSRHFHDNDSIALYELSLGAWFRNHLSIRGELNPGTQFYSLTPTVAMAPESSLVHMFDRGPNGETKFFGRISTDGGWMLETDELCLVLSAACQQCAPVALMGTAFNFVQLTDHLERQGESLRLPSGSCALETGGYKGRTRELTKDELYGRLETYLGLPNGQVVSEYGMSELSSQAYDLRVGDHAPELGERTYRFPPWARVRVVSPETGERVSAGETGLVQVFDLANVWSVMALQTGDLGAEREGGFVLSGRAPEAEPKGCSLLPDA